MAKPALGDGVRRIPLDLYDLPVFDIGDYPACIGTVPRTNIPYCSIFFHGNSPLYVYSKKTSFSLVAKQEFHASPSSS